jgi:pimeloyl-ACP methyl ester carboxylesterase
VGLPGGGAVSDFVSFDWVRGDARIACYRVPEWITGRRPAIVMLHGARRSARYLAGWAARLRASADVYLMDLPAHGRSTPVGSPSIANMAAVLGEAISDTIRDQPVLLVGESVGGLVGFALGGQTPPGTVRAVLALEPLMTTRKWWTWRPDRLAHIRRATLADSPMAAFDESVFGIRPDRVEERIYYDLIGGLQIPAIIAAGDRSLLVPNAVGLPAAFDDVDRFVIERLYPGKADIRVLTGAGHVLVDDAPDACAGLIDEMLQAHFGVRPAG